MARKITSEETLARFEQALDDQWPKQKFFLQVDHDETYGDTAEVAWFEGPEPHQVREVCNLFSGARTASAFGCGKWHQTHWLAPDGSVTLARDTAMMEEHDSHHPDAEEVSWGLDFINPYKMGYV